MTIRNRYSVFSLLVAAAISYFLFLAPAPVHASLGISLTPFESIKIDVSPGETITHRITLQLGQQDRAMDMDVDVMGFGSSLDGTPQGIAAAQDNSPYSARAFVTIDKPSFHLPPGGSQGIVATITVPPEVGDGGRYAIIYIHEQPPDAGGAGSLAAFNIPILLTIKGSPLTQTGKITEVTAGKVVSGQPIEIFTSFQNTGAHHFKVTGEVTVSNSQGDLLDTIRVPLSNSSVIPATLRQVRAVFIPKDNLPQGFYEIKYHLILEDGTTLDSANGGFEVTDSYAQPALPQTPSTAPTLPVSTPPTAPQSLLSLLLAGAAGGSVIAILAIIIGKKRK